MPDTTGASLDPVAVAARVAELRAIVDDREFAEALADCVMDPDPISQAAFRSDVLARRSYRATRFLLENVQAQIKHLGRTKGVRWRLSAVEFQATVGTERRLLELIVKGLNAREGLDDTTPNPRLRAMRRLAEENRRGPVAQGRITELIKEEQEADAARIAEAKAEKKRRAQAARAAQGLPNAPSRHVRLRSK